MKKTKTILIFICAVLCSVLLSGVFAACSENSSFDTSGKYLVVYNGNGGYLGSKTKTERRIYVAPDSKIPAYYDEYVDDDYILAGFGIATRTGYNLQGWYEAENITFRPSVSGSYIFLDTEEGNGAYVLDDEGDYELTYVEDENADYVHILADDSSDDDVQYVWYDGEFRIYDADGDVSDYQESYEKWGTFTADEVGAVKGYVSYTLLCDGEAFENAEKYAEMFGSLPRYKAVYAEIEGEAEGDRYSFSSEYVDIEYMFEAAENGSYVLADGKYQPYREGDPATEGLKRYNIKAQYVFTGTGSPSDMERYEAAPSKYWDFKNDRVNKNTTLYAHWTKKATVRFHFPDGTYTDITTKSVGSGKTEDIVQGGTIDVLERVPSQSGRTFVAWSRSENELDEWDFAEDLYPDDTVLLDLYAYMIEGTYTRITTRNGLAKVGEDPDGKYLLAADLDLGGREYTDENPLGFAKNGVFTGEFISFGKKISNFVYVLNNQLKVPLEGAFGLFPKTDGAKISGVKAEYTAEVKAESTALRLGDILFGGLIGSAKDTETENCFVDLVITAQTDESRTALFTYGELFAENENSAFVSCGGSVRTEQILKDSYGDNLIYAGKNEIGQISRKA